MAMGRPTHYTPELGQQIEDTMAQGYSLRGTCGKLDLTRSMVYDWKEKHPDFQDHLKRGFNKSLKFFEERLLAHSSGGDIPGFDRNKSNLTAIIFALKARFNEVYCERRQLDLNTDEPIQINVDKQDLDL